MALLLCILVFIVNKNIKALFISISLFLSLVTYTLDYHNYYPDVIRYYSEYEHNIFYALIKLKLYRFFVFSIMQSIGLNASFYSFFSIFIFFYFLLKSSQNYLLAINHKLDTIKKIILFLIIILSGVPFTIYFSFENMLAIVIFNYAISCYCLNNKYAFSFFVFLSLLIHSSVIILIPLFSIAILLYKKKIKIISTIICLSAFFSIITFLLNFEVNTGIDFIDSVFDKAYRYGSNEWSVLTTSELLHYIPIVLLKIAITLIISLSIIKDNKYTKINVLIYFSIIYSLTILFFIYNRMFSIRFGWSLSLISFILIYIYSMDFITNNLKKLIVILIVPVCLISIPNLFILSKIGNQLTFNNDFLFFNSIYDFNRKIEIPNRKTLNQIEKKTTNDRE